MNKFKKFTIGLAVAAAIAVPLSSSGQLITSPQVPNTFSNLAILPGPIAANTFSNLTSQPITLCPGFGVGVEITWTNASATATSNLTFTVNVSMDGTNWATTIPHSVTFATAAGITNRFYTNLVGTAFDSAAKARVERVTNPDTANAVSIKRILIGRARQNLVYPQP